MALSGHWGTVQEPCCYVTPRVFRVPRIASGFTRMYSFCVCSPSESSLAYDACSVYAALWCANITLLLGLWREQSPWVGTGQFSGMLLIWSWWSLQVCQLQICRANSRAQARPSVPNCPLALFVLGWLLTCFFMTLAFFWSILYSLRFLFVHLFSSFKITLKITFIYLVCVNACVCVPCVLVGG